MNDRSFYDTSWNLIPSCEVLARGENAIFILRDDIVIKMPLRTHDEEDLFTQTAKGIRNEQRVYQRLNSVTGILPVIRMLPDEMHLPFMKTGVSSIFSIALILTQTVSFSGLFRSPKFSVRFIQNESFPETCTLETFFLMTP